MVDDKQPKSEEQGRADALSGIADLKLMMEKMDKKMDGMDEKMDGMCKEIGQMRKEIGQLLDATPAAASIPSSLALKTRLN
jgi:hypothetical protein